jgi:hypothetical protein
VSSAGAGGAVPLATCDDPESPLNGTTCADLCDTWFAECVSLEEQFEDVHSDMAACTNSCSELSAASVCCRAGHLPWLHRRSDASAWLRRVRRHIDPARRMLSARASTGHARPRVSESSDAIRLWRNRAWLADLCVRTKMAGAALCLRTKRGSWPRACQPRPGQLRPLHPSTAPASGGCASSEGRRPSRATDARMPCASRAWRSLSLDQRASVARAPFFGPRAALPATAGVRHQLGRSDDGATLAS